MKYGLTQEFIKRTRERFKSGEISYYSAMLMFKEAYSNNLVYYVHGDIYDNRVETLVKVLKDEN